VGSTRFEGLGVFLGTTKAGREVEGAKVSEVYMTYTLVGRERQATEFT
jgi:hypothetical protein